MRRTRLLVTLAALVGSIGCASSGLPAPPTPEEIPALEGRVRSDPGDVGAAVALAAGYREAGRVEDARAVLAGARESAPEDGGVVVMLGLLAEDAGAWGEARAAYVEALAIGLAGALEPEVQRRLEVVRREELRARVAASLAREDELAASVPDGDVVGVFPFLFDGADPEWEPLAWALPEMLSTDLAVTGRLRVVERLHVQALLDELALGESGRVSRETAARSGRLLGSGTIVQGRLRLDAGQRVGVDAAVVEVGAPGAQQVSPLTDEAGVEQVLEMEKRIALSIHAELGIELTPAERERITERQTESIQALLAFGRGIEAESRGNFSDAERHFRNAVSIDPDFSLAAARGAGAARMVGVDMVAASQQVAAMARQITTKRQAVQLLQNAPPDLRDRVLQALGVQKRSIVQEVTGQDRIGQTILLELLFRAPGGEE
jgi:Tfp pilus assembly protein PilF